MYLTEAEPVSPVMTYDSAWNAILHIWHGQLHEIDIFSMAFFPNFWGPQIVLFLPLFHGQSLIGTECEGAVSSCNFFPFFHSQITINDGKG